MNWWRDPALLERLAGEYTLGTLHGGARRRFEAVMGAHPAVAQAVARWARQLAPLDARLPSLPADDALWQRIEGRVFGGAAGPAGAQRAASAGASAATTREPWWQRWLGLRPAAALAFGLMAGIAIPTLLPLLQPATTDGPQLPESYVGVLATAEGRPGLIISSLRHGRTLDIKQVKPLPLPAGRQWVLWVLDAQGRATAVAALPPLRANFSSVALPADSETLFAKAVELAISAEPADAALASLSGPSQAYAWRGLCGKLWPVVPPAAASAAAMGTATATATAPASASASASASAAASGPR